MYRHYNRFEDFLEEKKKEEAKRLEELNKKEVLDYAKNERREESDNDDKE